MSELFFIHHGKDGQIQRLCFSDMAAFVKWLREGKRTIRIEADGDVLVIRDTQ